MFDDIYKHLEFRQKYSAARRILNSLPGDLKCSQARSLIFDISLNILFNLQILYANEAESINPVEKDKEEQQPEVSSIVFLTHVMNSLPSFFSLVKRKKTFGVPDK